MSKEPASTPEEYLAQLKREQQKARDQARIVYLRRKLKALGYDLSTPGPVKGLGVKIADYKPKRKLIPGKLRGPAKTPIQYRERLRAEVEHHKRVSKRARINREREKRALELRAQDPTPSGVKG